MSFSFSAVTTDVTDAHVVLERAWAEVKKNIAEVSQDTELHVELAIRAAGTLIKQAHLGTTQQVSISGHAGEGTGASSVAISISEHPIPAPEASPAPL